MGSEIDICNQALSEIGTRSTIASFSEGSAESKQAAIWYDSQRQLLLRVAPWGFARATAPLSTLGSLEDGTSQIPWPYKYMYPTDCLRVRYLLEPPQADNTLALSWGTPSRNNRFLVANDIDPTELQRRVILGSVKDAYAVYIRDVTDTSLFDASFYGALASLLAYRFVIPLTGNKEMRSEFKAAAMEAITAARAADGNEAQPTTDHTPDWISTRGGGYAPYYAPWANLGNWYVGWDQLNWGS